MSNTHTVPSLPNPFRVMLAANPGDESKFPYGNLVASRKVDGVCGVIHPEWGPITRTNKPIPNVALRKRMQALWEVFPYLHGELVYGAPTAPGVAQASVSAVMTREAPADHITFHVFDSFFCPTLCPQGRLWQAQQALGDRFPFVSFLEPQSIQSAEQLHRFAASAEAAGYEGLVLRRGDAPYKFGRSTAREFGMVRYTSYTRVECEIVGTEPQFLNMNEVETDERGYTKRSAAKSGMVPMETLGAFIIKNPFDKGKTTLSVGTGEGLTVKERQRLWDIRDSLPGQLLTIKYKSYGSKDKPRQPIAVGLRSKDDL